MPSRTANASCPICGKPNTPAQTPFCSQGCRDRDLLQWLGEGYRLPVSPEDETGLDSDDRPSV